MSSKPYLDGILAFPAAPKEPDPLEDLFAEAEVNIREAAKRNRHGPLNERLTEIAQSFTDLYALPANWLHSGRVALIHEPSGTLLGNFEILTHKSVAGARRLVRNDSPGLAGGVEFVSEDWWLTGNHEVSLGERTEWKKDELHLLPYLHLPAFGVLARNVEVKVVRVSGYLAGVQLTSETTFHSPTGEGTLTLPQGTNILKGLDQPTKASLWQGGDKL